MTLRWSSWFAIMHRPQCVAVVDDDASVREAIDGLLRSAGLRVAAFGSAEEFLQLADSRSVGCLILDLRLPGMDGLALQRQLSRERTRLPVVVLTSHGDEAAAKRAVDAGAVAFLAKPFDGDMLIRLVKAVFV